MKPRTRRPRQRDSQALLEEAARAEFAEFGYAGARVERIAKRAGVNKQLVFYYFGSKQRLYDSIAIRVTGEARRPSEGSLRHRHAAENLRESFTRLFDTLARRRDLARLIVADVQHPRASGQAYTDTLRAFTEELRRVVVEGQGHGFFRDDIDPDRAAQQAVVLALGYVALERALEENSDAERARSWRDAAADLLVRALAW